LREGGSASEKELARIRAVRLADFKVPADYFSRRNPKGATGKLQRIGLAQSLVKEPLKEAASPWF